MAVKDVTQELDEQAVAERMFRAADMAASEQKPITPVERAHINGVFRQYEIESGLRPKEFWETQADAVSSAIASTLKVAPVAWKGIGRKLATIQRDFKFQSFLSKHWTPEQFAEMDAPKALEISNKEYEIFKKKNPLGVDVPDSDWAKIFNQPLDLVRANIDLMYQHRPDMKNEEIKGIKDLVVNPRKLVGAVVESVPILVGAGLLTYAGHPNLAFALMYATEGADAYEGAVSDGATEDQAQQAYQIYGLASAAVEFVQVGQGIKMLKRLGAHSSASKARTVITNQVAKKIEKRIAKYGEQSIKKEWLKMAVAESAEEMAQGQIQEWTARGIYGKKQEGGLYGWINRRGTEAMIAFAMSAPLGLAAVGIDRQGGQRIRDTEDVKTNEVLMKKVSGSIGFTEDDYNVPQVLDRNHRNAENFVWTVFGKKVAWYVPLTEKSKPYNGWAPPGDTSTIMLNAEMPDPMNSVALHEVVHQIESEDPAAYTELKETVFQSLSDKPAVESDIKAKFKESGLNLSPKDLESEIVSEAIGRLALDQNFLDTVSQGAPNALVRFQRSILKSVKTALRRKKTKETDAAIRWIDPFITDMASLSDRIAISLHQFGIKVPVLTVTEVKEVETLKEQILRQSMEESAKPPTKKVSKTTTQGALPSGKAIPLLAEGQKMAPAEAPVSKEAVTPIAVPPVVVAAAQAQREALAEQEIPTEKPVLKMRTSKKKKVSPVKTEKKTVSRETKSKKKPTVAPKTEILAEKPVREKMEYTNVPKVWFTKELNDYGPRGIVLSKGEPALPSGDGTKRTGKSFNWASQFGKIPVRLANKEVMNAAKEMTDEIVKVKNPNGEDYYFAPKPVIEKLKAEFGEQWNAQYDVREPSPLQKFYYALNSMESQAESRGKLTDEMIGENILQLSLQMGIPLNEVSERAKIYIRKFNDEQLRKAVAKTLQPRVEQAIPEPIELTDEQWVEQNPESVAEIGSFLDGLVEEQAPKPKKAPKKKRKTEAEMKALFEERQAEKSKGEGFVSEDGFYREGEVVQERPKQGVDFWTQKLAEMEANKKIPPTPKPSITRLPFLQKKLLDSASPVSNLTTDLQFREDAELIRKGWVLADGSVLPVQPVQIGALGYSKYGNNTWEHNDHAQAIGSTISSLIERGVARVARFYNSGKSNEIAFELDLSTSTSEQVDVMRRFAAQNSVRGETNHITVHSRKGKFHAGYGIASYQSLSEVDGAFKEALEMARAQEEGRPSIIRSKSIKQVIAEKSMGKSTAPPFKMTEQELLKLKLKAEQKASRLAYQQGWRDMGVKLVELRVKFKKFQEIRRELVRWVKKTIPPAYRGRMLSAITNATTERTVEKAVEKLQREIENVAKREQLARLKSFTHRVMKKYGRKRRGMYKEGGQFKMAPEFSIVFERFYNTITMKRDEKQEDVDSLKELIEFVQQEKASAEAALQAGETTEDNFYLANEIIPTLNHLEEQLHKQSVLDFDTETLRELTDSLETILSQWEWQRDDDPKSFNAKELREARLDKLNITSEIMSNWKKPKAIPKRDVQGGKSPYRSMSIVKGLLGRFNYNLQTMAYIVSGAQKRRLWSMFEELAHSRDYQKSVVFALQDFVAEEMKKAGISTNDIVRWSRATQVRKASLPTAAEEFISRVAPGIIRDAVSRPGLTELSVPLKSGQTINMTVGEALNIVMQARGNAFQYNALLDSGIVFRDMPTQVFELKADDLQAIRDALPEKAKKMVGILDSAVSVMQEKINSVSVHIDGYMKANIDGYWHLRRFKERGVRGKETKYEIETIANRSHWKERTGGTAPILVVDALNEFVDTVQVSGEYIGMTVQLRRIKGILKDEDILKIVREKGYEDYWNDMKTQIEKVEDRKGEQDFVSSIYSKWIRNVTRAIFSINLRVSAQQYASIFLAASDFGYKHLSAIRFIPDKTLEARIVKHSSLLRERFQGHVNRELGDVAQSGGVLRFYTGQQQLIDYPTFLVSWFDKMAVLDTWRMAESATKAMPQYKGKSDAELFADTKGFMDIAMAKAEESIRNSQPTWDVTDRSIIGSERNPLVRGVTMFHSQREKMAQMIGKANSKYINDLNRIVVQKGLSSMSEAVLTKEGLKAMALFGETYGLVLFNNALVDGFAILYAALIYGKPDEDPWGEFATSLISDIPSMYYFGEIPKKVIDSWSSKMRGLPVRQLGGYELAPYRVPSTVLSATYEIGNLVMMNMGPKNYTSQEVEKQAYKTLDKSWEAVNYALGLPFNHLTTIVKKRI